MIRLAVIGIGQSLRGDDAAGLEAVQTWRLTYPQTAESPDIRVITAELPGLSLLEMLEGVQGAIIVDAVRGGAEPGRVHRVGSADLEAFSAGSKSAHGWGAAETLRLGREMDPDLRKLEIRIIGIETADFALGSNLSPAVREALPRASTAIQEQVESLWRR